LSPVLWTIKPMNALLDFILDVETKPDFAELTRVLKGFVLQ